MTFTDWFRSIFVPYSVPTPEKRVALIANPKPPPAGRTSFDTPASFFSGNWVAQPPTDYEGHWRMVNLDIQHLDLYTPKELLDSLIDLSPEIAKAVWDFQRLCNPGWEYKAYNPGSEDKENARAKKHLDEFFTRLREEYGSVDILIGRFFIGAYLRGAFCSELVLDGSANESLDLVAPDPYSIRFRKKMDPLRKEVWEPGQWQGNQWTSLAIPTFKYLPVDPAPASPYGRPLAAPALFTAIFILGLLHDVKRVVMQQGYKRMDIVLDTERAEDSFSYDSQGYASYHEYMMGAISAIKTAYAQLQPDDAFVHTDLFKMEQAVGTLDSDSIGAIATIFDRLEKMVTRGLKSTSLLLESGESPGETDSNRRWEIHAAGIKSLQHHCESMLESQLQTSLRAKGLQARVVFRFAELRASEQLRDEQTRQLKIQNAVAERDAGFVSQDEASNSAVNHDAFSQEPLAPLEDNIQGDNGNSEEDLNKNTDDRWVTIHENNGTTTYQTHQTNGNSH
jgi:hypothetical protein